MKFSTNKDEVFILTDNIDIYIILIEEINRRKRHAFYELC